MVRNRRRGNGGGRRRQNIFSSLNEFNPTVEITSLYNNKFKIHSELTQKEAEVLKLLSTKTQTTEENYHDVYSYAVQIEDIHQKTEQSKFAFVDCEIVSVDSVDRNKYKYVFRPDELIPLFVNKQHKILLFDECQDIYYDPTPNTGIFFYSNTRFMIFALDEPVSTDRKYTIRFVPNRLTFRLEHWALQKVKKLNLAKRLLEPKFKITIHNYKLDFIEKKIYNNPEQRAAVEAIVQTKSSAAPFLLIGYPGTGKTQVIVEAIHQLLMKNPKNRILVCAGINDVLDEIALRLQKSLFSTTVANSISTSTSTSTSISPINIASSSTSPTASTSTAASSTTNNNHPNKKLLRYYASAYEDRITDINLLGISNFDQNDKSYDNLKEAILETDVVLCTFAMAGRISLANIGNSYFTHLFIDEAQSATEPSTLIPIAGLCVANQQICTQIILAGDTKQLGPLVSTNEASTLGYGLSMMERLLLQCDIYQPNQHTHNYNPLLMCKLVRNYRSHPEILKMPNELFYNNEMISCASEVKTNRNEVTLLPTTSITPKEFPKKFYSVYGFADTETNCTSWFNRKEINYIIDLLKNLVDSGVYQQTEIGIITPYKRQALKIEERLYQNNMQLIKVGSVRQFMSQEKSVIIVSTVRSNSRNLGFLTDEKNITVMLTRAISLLIFVGNTKTLMSDPNWKKIIVDCSNHNSVYMTSG